MAYPFLDSAAWPGEARSARLVVRYCRRGPAGAVRPGWGGVARLARPGPIRPGTSGCRLGRPGGWNRAPRAQDSRVRRAM